MLTEKFVLSFQFKFAKQEVEINPSHVNGLGQIVSFTYFAESMEVVLALPETEKTIRKINRKDFNIFHSLIDMKELLNLNLRLNG